MYKVIAVTNRKLCNTEFLEKVERIASMGIDSIILREKDLTEEEYFHLAKRVLEICTLHHVPCTLHTFREAAEKLKCPRIHLPLSMLQKNEGKMNRFNVIGTSVHSVEQAVLAERLGATYLTAGHIFPTECKKDLPPRGTQFLKEVCCTVHIPVFAIGGISSENISEVLDSGAAGVCIMSGFMQDSQTLLK